MSEEPAKKSGWGELGRSTAPEDRSGPGPAATVYWTGSLGFGRFNLDLSPPIQTGDTYITGGSGGVLESYHDAGKLSVWKSSGTPDRNACATTLAEGTKSYISGLLKSNHVRGRTAQGRVFRIDVTAAGDEVTVWEK
ncbi:hypothetical protein [Kutzneria albida]|uniref:Uncharacterized protein n=1 Tax=Kutzneria albida DSM 43870 TaxID=1449976 RepID=W5WM48_9PSEU|nr:hypothetical protein [Kutzneria albida]AHI01856.1 hypothetical protein KALB_8499 [Kutzneria albida DSM 43870]